MKDTSEFVVDADHPALPGHFPHKPLVPGSLILELVIAGQPPLRGQALRIESVKFIAPLRPGQRVAVMYRESAPDCLSFSCRAEGKLICKGQIAPATPP